MGWTTMRGGLPALGVVLWALAHASGAGPAAAGTEPRFQQVVLDNSYIAYERDVGDIDGDRHNDVAAVMEGDTTVQVFHAPTWKRSTLVTFTGECRYPRADDFKLADMDGDGDLDVVTRLGKGPSDDGAGISVWCENLGGGSKFIQHLIGSSPEYVKDIVVADFDRDGRPDVAMRMDSRTQLWLQEPGRTWTEVLLTHPAHEGMEAGDLDMDGDPDLIFNGYWFATPDTSPAARVAANYACHVIDSAWFNQTGDWTKNSCKVVVGDFNGDRRNDVAFSHSERAGHAVAWYGSATPCVDGAWNKHAVAVVDYCHTLQAADFDLDGDVDLLAGGMIQSQHRGLRLLLNGGTGTNWSQLVIQTDGSYSAELGDIDNDGDLDIVGIRNWNAAPTWIYRNNTHRGAMSPQVVASRDSPWGGVKATLGDGPEGDGTILLENRVIRVRCGSIRPILLLHGRVMVQSLPPGHANPATRMVENPGTVPRFADLFGNVQDYGSTKEGLDEGARRGVFEIQAHRARTHWNWGQDSPPGPWWAAPLCPPRADYKPGLRP